MMLMNQLRRLENDFREALSGITGLDELRTLRVRFLGKKGSVSTLLRQMGQLSPAERPRMGQALNSLRRLFEELLAAKEMSLKEREAEKRLEQEAIDVTLPGRPFPLGRKHPLTLVQEEIETIFTGLGFRIARGPEIESDYYNFEALNFQQDHPNRDMQDSFYVTPEFLLRTHTSPVQIRTMELQAPRLPLRVIAPGKVYRRDDDLSHSPMFHQVEGLAVDRGVTLSDLKGTLLLFAREMFGSEQRLRFRPSFFPFTEPSAEVDILCIICGGAGCRTCGQSGWLEILGAGMVHPRVLEAGGYDPADVTGFAFGMGVERIAMLKYGVEDLRAFFVNDLRFLRQFR